MNKITLFFPLVLIILLFKSSDSSAASGYYIKLNGDTVKGAFLNIPDRGNPGPVDFIPTGSSETVTIKPEEVKALKTGNYDFFISYNGTRRVGQSGAANKPYYIDTIHTFLREIGETSGYLFYSLNDSKGLNLFYAENNGVSVELNSSKMILPNEQNIYFRKQLESILSSRVDTSILMPMLGKLDYTEESFISFIYDINDATEEHSNVPEIRGFIVTAGYSYNIFSVTGSNTIPYVATDYKEGGSFLFGFGYIKPLKKGDNRYFIYPNIKAFNYETSGSITRYDGIVTSKFKSDLVLFPVFNVGYHIINKAGISLFLSPGFGFLIAMNNNEETNYAYYDGTNDYDNVSKTRVAFDVNLQTGLFILQRYMIWGSYNIPTPLSSQSYYTSNLAGLQFGVGYKF